MLNIPHKKIGKYLLFSSKKLAQLKYSSVFLGLHSQTKQKVLIKTFSKAQFQNNSLLMISMQFQINAMKILKSQKVLKFRQLIETANNYYMILEQPTGISIKKTLQTKGVFTQSLIIQNLKKLRKTFQTLNKYNIIHGNINAKSILLSHGDAKLGYPSYIKAMESIQNIKCNSFCGETQTIKNINDFLYMAPELLQSGIISPKYDIWSLGIVLYQALFNQLPWNIDKKLTIKEILNAINNEQLEFPSNLEITIQLKHFIIHCLKPNPEQRFSWEEFLDHSIFFRSWESENQKQFQSSIQQTFTSQNNFDSMKGDSIVTV